MVLEDVTNFRARQEVYTTSTILPSQYRPLIERGKSLASQTPRSEFPAKRKAGATNIDLWLDGSVYPTNPVTQLLPPFRDMKSMLCFIGDGVNSLLGYVTALQSAHENGLQCTRLAKFLAQGENSRRIL